MAKIKKTDHNKCWQGCGGPETLIPCWWECKMIQPLWRIVWQFLKKLNICLPCDPAISLLGIYLEEMKTYVHKRQMLKAALFAIAQNWKQSKCSSTGE